MSKGLIGIVLVAAVALIVGMGFFYTNLIYRMESMVRAVREASIIEAVNVVEFVKRALLPSLRYSFYQASYNISAQGGFPRGDCVPYWRVYTDVYYPSVEYFLIHRALQHLNQYAFELGAPEYEQISVSDQTLWCDYTVCSECDRSGVCQGCNLCTIDKICIFEGEDKPTCTYFTHYKAQLGWPPCIWTNPETCEAYCSEFPCRPPGQVLLSARSPQWIEFEAVNLRLFDDPNMRERTTSYVLEMEELGRSISVVEDKINAALMDAIQAALQDRVICEQLVYGPQCEETCGADSYMLHDEECPDWENDLKNYIAQKLSELEVELSTPELVVKINYDLDTDIVVKYSAYCDLCEDVGDCEDDKDLWSTTCYYEYYADVRVLISITDNTASYPVYDYTEGTTNFRNIQLKFWVLTGTAHSLEPPPNLCMPCEADEECLCPSDTCIDADGDREVDDLIDYPKNGKCVNRMCEVGTGDGQPCKPRIVYNGCKVPPTLKLMEAIKCAYYRCTKGCEEAIAETNSLIFNCAQFCEPEWQDEEGKICDQASKDHPVEITLGGSATIDREWWKTHSQNKWGNDLRQFLCRVHYWYEWGYKDSDLIFPPEDYGVTCTGHSWPCFFTGACTLPEGEYVLWTEHYWVGPFPWGPHTVICPSEAASS